MSEYSDTGPVGEGPTVEPDLPEAKLEEAIAFLRRVRPDGHWTLTAIFSERDSGPTQTETFGPDTADEALAWLEKRSGRMNLYWMVNPALRPLDSKAKRADVKEMVALWVDIDPKGEGDGAADRSAARARLAAFSPSPSFVIDSGGGVQAFWVLDQPLYIGGDVPAADDAARYNQQLETDLAGDSCHNLDRVMRLPGTINLPDAGKRAKGRRPRRAELLEYHDDRVYSLAEFAMAEPGISGGSESRGRVSLERGQVRQLGDTEELDQWNVPGWAKAVIAQGHNPLEPDKWGGDRSRAVYAVACELVAREVPPELIVGILTDRDLGISSHILAQKRHIEYAWYQVERATAAVAQRGEAFATDKNDVPIANHQGNIRLALRKLGVELRHDTFADRSVIEGLDGHGPHLDDAARDRLWLEIDELFRFRPHLEFFTRVLMDTARNAPFHPVCDYLDGLKWDGVPRLDRWLVTYGGAENSEYTRAVGALPLIAAARRVREPGAKFDEMLILESEQGTDKSSALRVLAVRDEQFGDDLPLNADGKKVIEQTAGKWIIEAGELKGMRKGEVEHLKSFLSRQDDTARLSYARLPVIVPRQFVVIGTTNSERYLRDLTGNRRFWPVRVGRFDLEALRRDRDQIWAEAAAREAKGDSIRLDPSLYAAAGVEQEARRVEDPFVALLAAALEERTGKVRAADVWKLLGIPAGQQTQEQNARLGDAMRELGWERIRRRFGGKGLEYGYARGNRAQMERRIEVCLGASGWVVDEVASDPEVTDDEFPY